ESLLALVDEAVRLARPLGGPQDVEWAIDHGGSRWVLQSRPIVLRRPARISLWDNSNIVESYPGITTPLTYSFVRNVYEQVFRETLTGFGADPAFLRDDSASLTHLVGYIRGRVYYNLVNWYNVVSALQGGRRNRSMMEMMMGVKRSVDEERELAASLRPVAGGWRRALSLAFSTGWLFLTVGRRIDRLMRELDEFFREVGRLDLERASGHELMELYYRLEARFLARWALTNYNDFFAMRSYALLRQLAGSWVAGAPPGLANDLLCGERGMKSVEPVKSLLAVAEAFRKDPEALALLEAGDPSGSWDRLHQDPRWAAVAALLDRHLASFDDRSLHELKLETPPLSENLPFFLGLVDDHARAGRSIDEMERAEARIRESAEERVRLALAGHPIRRLIFALVLGRTRYHVKERENLRFARTRVFGVVKRTFKALGARLAAAGLLDDPRDVFFLEHTEVFDLVRGTSTLMDVKALVALRRQQLSAWEREPPPGRFTTRDLVCPALAAVEAPDPEPAAAQVQTPVLTGLGCCPGRVRGRARVVTDPCAERGIRGEILVTPMTDPGWVFLMISAGGIVVEKGSLLSHTAIIGRELGIPTVVGVEGATRLIRQGQEVELDGDAGTVTLR
ncbi:MAG: hypothetical protein HY815_21130, partial [Candidatus Riflebacteria bacterium]|nr:hypothetical protein [Candidatus Riflebacteria bacterium]